MMTTYIALSILLGIGLFPIGWFLGRQRAQKMETIRREKRAAKLIGQMFSDLQMDHLPEKETWDHNIQYLEHCLKEALDNEDYEKAAQIRDLIKNQE